ncbi:MAG TPA: hypothetical protein V6D47_00245 [Oscillatoriaceae cyanobacterium]
MRLFKALLAGLLLVGCSANAPDAENAVSSLNLPGFDNTPTAVSDGEPSPDVPLTGAFLFFDDFEHGTRKWTIGGGSANPHWALLHAPTCTGAYVMHLGKPDVSNFTPAAGEQTLTLVAPIDLTGAKRPQLTYDVLGSDDPQNAIVVQPEVQVDGGAWTPVGTPALARYDLTRTRFADLTAYDGKRVLLRFDTVLEPSGAATKGMFLDNVQVIEPQMP